MCSLIRPVLSHVHQVRDILFTGCLEIDIVLLHVGAVKHNNIVKRVHYIHDIVVFMFMVTYVSSVIRSSSLVKCDTKWVERPTLS